MDLKKIIGLSIFVLLVAASTAFTASLAGKATVAGESVAGVTVSVYPVATVSFADTPEYQSTSTTADGEFSLDVTPGQYYVIARGENLFTYYGRNPLSVPKEGVQNINMLMVPTDAPIPVSEPLIETGVIGAVTYNGQPIAGASATIYPDLSRQLKGFGLGMSQPTDENGLFEVPLEPGDYFLVVRLRKSGAFAGPLRAGDLFGYFPGNSVKLNKGEVKRVAIPLIEVPEKVDRFATSLFGNTTISGTIVGREGQPIEGLRALLYSDSMMIKRPDYVSQPTGKDGHFVLSFPQGGTYFLAARNLLGGIPGPGELYGLYAGTRNGSIYVRTGKNIKNVVITVEELR